MILNGIMMIEWHKEYIFRNIVLQTLRLDIRKHFRHTFALDIHTFDKKIECRKSNQNIVLKSDLFPSDSLMRIVP